MKILAAEHVLPISRAPIENGAVAIDGDRIAAVGTVDEIRALYTDAELRDFGSAVILPGFVNCHSHLEITSMRGALDAVEHDFKSWLLRLNEIRSGLSNEDIDAAATLGADEGARAGVTCFGDIGRYGDAGLKALKSAGLRGVLFQETEFSPDNSTAEADFDALRSKFESLSEGATPLVEVGISPHSPYTVSEKLFELIGRYAIDEEVKLTIHVAESAEESALMLDGVGFFTAFYDRMGLEWNSPRCSSVEYLSRTGVLDARPLLAHCVTVSESDIELIRRTGSRIAHCPKSNAKFGHGVAPFEKFLEAGVAVGLGSDSVASNNLCDLIEESRFAALVARNREDRKGFMTARQVLEAATMGGAKALGLEEKIGTLDVDKQADLGVISLANPAQSPINDIEAAVVFSSSGRDVVLTMVAGKEVYSKDQG